MNELKWMNWHEWIENIERNELPKAPIPWVFDDFYLKWSSRYSLAHILSTSSSKSGPRLSVFFFGFYVKSSSRYSLVRILSTSSSKSAKKMHSFIQFLCESSSRYSLVHILSTRALSGSRRATAETETLQRRPGTATYPKRRRVLRPRVFSAVNSLIPDRSHFPSTWLWCDWHDDVVDMLIEMVMSMPWWWDN